MRVRDALIISWPPLRRIGSSAKVGSQHLMKKLRLITVAAGAIITMTGAAAAQQSYFGVGPEPGPRPYYRDYPPGYHDRPGYYRRANAVESCTIIDPADIELGMDASLAGLCKTVSANRTEAIEQESGAGRQFFGSRRSRITPMSNLRYHVLGIETARDVAC
jgi:hypothetical protein